MTVQPLRMPDPEPTDEPPGYLDSEEYRASEYLGDEPSANGRGPGGEVEAIPTTWAVIDLGPILAGGQIDESPTLLARDDGPCLLYAGKIHGFQGEPESCKGWLALWACTQEIQAGGHVLYIDFEDAAPGVVGRLLDLGVASGAIAERFHYVRPDEPLTDRAWEDIAVALAFRPRLVVIDGVTEAMVVHGLDLGDNTDVAKFLDRVPRRLAATGAAVVQIDHVVKDPANRNRWAIGGQHKLAGTDGAVYALEVIVPFGRGREGLVHVEVAKDRPGYVRQHAVGAKRVAELRLESHPDGGVTIHLCQPESAVDPETGTFRPTKAMEAVAELLDREALGLSGQAVEAGVRMNHGTVRLALELLVNDGYVIVEPGARGAKVHKLARPYPDVEPDRGEEF